MRCYTHALREAQEPAPNPHCPLAHGLNCCKGCTVVCRTLGAVRYSGTAWLLRCARPTQSRWYDAVLEELPYILLLPYLLPWSSWCRPPWRCGSLRVSPWPSRR